MSEMIERVAMAIHNAEYGTDAVFSSRHPAVVEFFRHKARAAIEAMREPTEEVLAAMSEGFGKEPSRDDPMPHYLQRQKNALRAMIDAALAVTNGDHK